MPTKHYNAKFHRTKIGWDSSTRFHLNARIPGRCNRGQWSCSNVLLHKVCFAGEMKFVPDTIFTHSWIVSNKRQRWTSSSKSTDVSNPIYLSSAENWPYISYREIVTIYNPSIYTIYWEDLWMRGWHFCCFFAFSAFCASTMAATDPACGFLNPKHYMRHTYKHTTLPHIFSSSFLASTTTERTESKQV